MNHYKSTIAILFQMFVLILVIAACDKHEVPQPVPTQLTSTEPGVVQFQFEQHSQGSGNNLVTDSLFLIIKNQGPKSINNIQYAVRGFSSSPKCLKSFSYWDEDMHHGSIKPHQKARIRIHNDYHQLLPNELLEVDLISYQIQGDRQGSTQSGRYEGEFTVFVDSLMTQPVTGLHRTWIDHKGDITIYFDCKSLSWYSFSGRQSSLGTVLGTLTSGDQQIDVSGRLHQPVNSSNYRLHFDFSQETDTTHHYQFSLTLNN